MVIECALLGCTLVPSMKSVGEIASEIGPVLWFFTHFWENFTLTFDLDLGSRSSALGHWMCLIWLYLGTKYEVCTSRWNSLRDMTSSLVFYPLLGKFDLDLWPWPWVKVIGTRVIECAFLGCTLVPSMKSVCEIAFEIWPVLYFFTIFGEIWPWSETLTLG